MTVYVRKLPIWEDYTLPCVRIHVYTTCLRGLAGGMSHLGMGGEVGEGAGITHRPPEPPHAHPPPPSAATCPAR